MFFCCSRRRPSNITADQLSRMFSYVSHFQGVGNATTDEYSQLHSILLDNNLTVSHLTNRLSPNCGELLERCMWKGTQARCDTLFQPINTTEGLCCSFNYYALKTNNYLTYVSYMCRFVKINQRHLFFSKTSYSMPKTPRRVTACGFQTGLTILARPMMKDYHTTFFSSYGIRVRLDNS